MRAARREVSPTVRHMGHETTILIKSKYANDGVGNASIAQ